MGTAEGALKARQKRLEKREAEAPALDDCKLLLAGVDSLHLSSRADVRPELVRELLELKEVAREQDREGLPLPRWRTNVIVNGVSVVVDLEMQPGGTRKGDLLLTSDAMVLVVHSKPPRNLPRAYVELHAVFLWQGWDYASDVGSALLRDVASDPASVDVQVSRIDLAADFMGWQLEPEDRARFRGRFSRWRRDFDDDEDRPWYDEHGVGRRFTGFTFGRRHLLARIYDKTVELAKSGKLWFIPKWQAAGYRDQEKDGHVWRLEFQVRRDVLRKCELVTAEMKSTPDGVGSSEMKRWADVKKGLNDLWRYLTTKWLTYRLPRTGKKRVRFHPRWVALMKARLTPLPDGELYRHQRLWNMDRYLAALVGYAKREAALEWQHYDQVPSEQRFEVDLMRMLRTGMKAYEERHGESLYDAARAQWVQRQALERLFGRGQLGRAKAEQLQLG